MHLHALHSLIQTFAPLPPPRVRSVELLTLAPATDPFQANALFK